MLSRILALGLLATCTHACLARPDAPTRADIQERALTAQKLRKPISIELNDARLEDIITFIEDFSGAQIEPFWSDDGAAGLKKDQRLSVSVRDGRVITLIERVLAKAETEFSPATWQFAPSGGAIEVGPRSSLNKQAYLRIYDIQDLLYQIPDFVESPQLDLDQLLNQGGRGGGGGGGSPFGNISDENIQTIPEPELAQRIIDLITANVEPEQWIDNGGDGGSIQYTAGHLLIRAPDYMHRQIIGYPFDVGRGGQRPAPKR